MATILRVAFVNFHCRAVMLFNVLWHISPSTRLLNNKKKENKEKKKKKIIKLKQDIS